jgi:hypothetical protein
LRGSAAFHDVQEHRNVKRASDSFQFLNALR